MAAKMKGTILIVEDELDIARLIEKFLKLKDFDTIISTKAKKALKIIKESYDKIDLILLDIMMPGRDGYTVLEEVKNNEKFKDIPVVVINQRSDQVFPWKELFLPSLEASLDKKILPLNEILVRIKEVLGKEGEE